MTFNLRETIREIATTRDEWDLTALVNATHVATPRDELDAAYREALREIVRVELGNIKQTSRPGHSSANTQSATAGAGTPKVGRSWTTLMRAGFRMSVHVAPGGKYRALGLCSAVDLLFAAEECERNADANARAAQRYRDLAKLLTEHGAATVADLPEDIVNEVFSDDDH